jgi:hypothetical protein
MSEPVRSGAAGYPDRVPGDHATAIAPFHFDPDQMGALADSRASSYASADPFPHVVFDNFLPADRLRAAVDEFPGPQDIPWQLFEDGGRTLKLASENQQHMGELTRQLFAELNGAVFVDFLERLTGVPGVVPDPYLVGGGLHQIEPGGFLDVHADFNIHPRTRLHRRLNALIYLNEDWQDDWGGQLELWDSNMSRCVQRIAPVFNRCVIFSTDRSAFHGHPQKVACPPGRNRRSLALYYYSQTPAPGEDAGSHSTLYQTPGLRPDGAAGHDHAHVPNRGNRDRLRRWLPPVAVDAARKLRDRGGRKA